MNSFGSSLLYRTLQKHPSFRLKMQNLVEAEVVAHLRRTFLFSPEYPDKLQRFMLDDPATYGALLRSIPPRSGRQHARGAGESRARD